MATHSSILAWRIPWTEEPGGLQSTGSQRVGHDWATSSRTHRSLACRVDHTLWFRGWKIRPVSLILSNLIRHVHATSGTLAWCGETKVGCLWFSLSLPSPVLTHQGVTDTPGVCAKTQRQRHLCGVGRATRSKGRSWENLSGRTRDRSVHLCLIQNEIPRRSHKHSWLKNSQQKCPVLCPKGKTTAEKQTKERSEWGQGGRDASYKYKGSKDNEGSSKSWRW